jgi:hypothetical protein
VPEDTECVITIGGDGTLIQAARDHGLLLFLNSMIETSLSFIHFAFSLRGRPISALTGMGRRLSAVRRISP